VATHGEEFLELIRDPSKLPGALPFPPRPENREPSDAEKRCESRLRAWRQSESKRRKLTPHAILPSRALMWIKSHGTDALEEVPQLGDKRIQRYGDQLRRLCHGDA
ncbi:MAG: HRDC domain-containing protein, partial [Myxococcales bacterium]|nr:HRDC domain-containing protein [Myxococcales bacterium]